MTPTAATIWARNAGLSLEYGADLDRLAAVDAPFIELGVDEATARYISDSKSARHGRWKTWLHRRLRTFLSDFDINGLLGTYPMHVLSTQQWKVLLAEVSDDQVSSGRLLDVGAGRGDATRQLANLFRETVVTETSRPMARRLKKQGYECLVEDITDNPTLFHRFDAVSLLNVLDRCDSPMSLLGAARSALRPGGLLLIALVLPYRPFVYDHGVARAPKQRLAIASDQWEMAACEFVTTCLIPLGLEVVCLSRAPYLSGGDAQAPLYELDDLLVVARAQNALPVLGS